MCPFLLSWRYFQAYHYASMLGRMHIIHLGSRILIWEEHWKDKPKTGDRTVDAG